MSPYRVCFVVLALLLTLVSPALASDHNSTVEHNPPGCNADRTNWTIGLLFCNGEASQGYTQEKHPKNRPPLFTLHAMHDIL